MNVQGNSICSSCSIKISTLKISQPTSISPPQSVDSNKSEGELSLSDTSENKPNTESDNEPAEYEKAELIDSLNRNILPALRLSPIKEQKMSSEKYNIQISKAFRASFWTIENVWKSS